MIQADDPTSLVTQHNVDETAAQMDALQQLYSLKNLQRRERKLSKTKTQMQASRKASIHVFPQNKLICDDFVQMTLQSEEVVSWDLLALLHEFRNMYVIGIVGKPTDIQRFIHKLTGEMLEMPAEHSDCLHFSRRWVWPGNSAVSWCFVIRYVNLRVQNQSSINDIVFSIVPHLLVVFESATFDLNTVLDSCRKYQPLTHSITRAQQSLFLHTPKDRPTQLPKQLFMQTIISCQLPTSLSFVDTSHQQLLSLLSRSIKRNYFTILNTQPITLYYLIVSLWTYMKRLLTISDSMLGSMVNMNRSKHMATTTTTHMNMMDTGTLTHIYLQVLDKELRFNYKIKVEEFLKEPREEFFLYQCLKEEKEQCLGKFKKYSGFCRIEKTKTYNKLCEFIKQSQVQIHKWNEQTNFRLNLQLAQSCCQNITYKMSKSLYHSTNQQQFHQDFKHFLQTYQQSSIGITSGQALSEYLKNFMPIVYRYFDNTTKEEIKQIVDSREKGESRDGIHERIAMTEGLLATLERDINEIENRRVAMEKKRRKREKEAMEAKDAIREAKEDAQRVRREIITTNRVESRTHILPKRAMALVPEQKKQKKKCQLI